MDKRFVKKSGLYFIGNVSSKVVNMLLIPLYAVFVIPDDLGTFDYSQTIMSIVVPFLYLAIWEASLKFLLSGTAYSKEKVLGSSSILVILISSFSMVGYGLYLLVSKRFDPIIFMSILMILARSFEQIWLFYARGLCENKLFVTTSIWGTLCNVATNVILLCGFNLGIYALFLSYIFSQFLVMILLESKLHIFQYARHINFDSHIAKAMIGFSAPLALNSAAIWIMSGLGRMIIAQILGFDAAGQYAFANKFGVIPTTLGYVVSMALIEESILKAGSQDADQYITKTLQVLSRLFLEIIILLMPVIAVFYGILGETKYHESIAICPWLLYYAVSMVQTQNMGAVFQAKGKTKYQFLATIVGSSVMLVLSYLSIYIWKTVGVAAAQMLASVVVLMVCNLFVNKISSVRVSQKEIIILSVVYFLVSSLCINGGIYISMVLFLALAAIVCMKERAMFIGLFRLIHHKTKTISG